MADTEAIAGLGGHSGDPSLRAVVAALPRQQFAVLDGGQYADLPGMLKRERLFARSLFLETASDEVQAAGPWLVKLDQAPEAADRIFSLVGDKPAAVYWSCAGGDAPLWHHLRGINVARIPRWAADGHSHHRDQNSSDDRSVMFRHWDPRVLEALMPVLNTSQFARVLGPAHEIAFKAEALRRIIADPAWPPAPSGMLKIDSEQAEALNRRRIQASRRRIAAYLRESAPAITENATDAQLLKFVEESEMHGRDLGLESEAAHGRWAYLMLRSEKRILQSPRALDFIRRGEAPPDQQMRLLLRETAAAIRDAERRHGRASAT